MDVRHRGLTGGVNTRASDGSTSKEAEEVLLL